jgi:thiol-disulfide isomerase/thioredoxin
MRWIRLTLTAAAVALAIGTAHAHDWNDSAIAWKPYEQGLAQAKKEKKPVCLIFYTEWCPHCANYSKVFHDPKVVAESKKFVMIRLDNDKEKELSGKYSPDGAYIPRTLFLSSEGVLDPELHATRENYKYFYDEKDPAPLVAGMEAAATKLK